MNESFLTVSFFTSGSAGVGSVLGILSGVDTGFSGDTGSSFGTSLSVDAGVSAGAADSSVVAVDLFSMISI